MKLNIAPTKSNLLAMKEQLSVSTNGYELLEETGPAHDREYLVAAIIGGEEKARGRGRTKKAAEQAAAYEILKSLHRI